MAISVTESSKSLGTPVRRIVRGYLPLVILFVVYYVAIISILDNPRSPISFDLVGVASLFQFTTPYFVGALAALLCLRAILFPTATPLRQWVSETAWFEVIFQRFIPSWIFAYLVLKTFAMFKPHIPDLNPFSWDLAFLQMDRLILLGWDAWELTYAVLPGTTWAVILDRIYGLWFHILFAGVCVAACLPLNSRARFAFLASYALTWIIGGSVLATIFSSAGPIYVERLFDDVTYVPLTDALQSFHAESPLVAVGMIEVLWSAYQGDPNFPELGISAFPSLHLGMASLIMCFSFTFGRIWACAGTLFTVVILIGSVHLGWHYLVDGLAGIAMGCVFWGISWAFAGWWLRET